MKRFISLLLVLVTLTACFVPSVSAEGQTAGAGGCLPFEDVKSSHWFTSCVSFCYANGIIKGMNDHTFGWKGELTRAQFVTMLANLEGVDTSGYTVSRFTDVKPNYWFYGAVAWAYEKGIVSGMSDTCFAPAKALTRAELAVIMRNYMDGRYGVEVKEDALDAFTDKPKSEYWYYDAMKYAVSAELISGNGEGTLAATGTVTRAQAAVIFKSFMEKYFYGGCEHVFSEADCTNASLCTRCGMINGFPVGHILSDGNGASGKCSACGKEVGDGDILHNYAEATCTEPMTCKRCGTKTGELLAHEYIKNICILCGRRPYYQKEGNDAVSAAAAITDRVVESGCSAEMYIMDVTLDTVANTLSGKMTVDLVNESGAGLNEICFRYFAPAIMEESRISSVRGLETGEEYGFEKGADGSLYRVALPKPLADGEAMSVVVDFISHIPDKEDRYGIINLSENKKIYNLTFCFPQIAFLDDGVWFEEDYLAVGESRYNEPSDYYVTLHAPEDYVVLSSGRSTTQGTETVIIAENIREMAISACNCAEIYTRKTGGITYNLLKVDFDYQNAELLEDTYELIMETAIESVEVFSADVGRYIYDELDIIPVIYGNIGGMEYPGIVQVALPDSDRNGKDAEAQRKNFFSKLSRSVVTTAHEVAHEWFYCAVGNDEMNEPWLDESFASYLEYYYNRTGERAFAMYEEMWNKYNALNGECDIASAFPHGFDYGQKSYYINIPADGYREHDYVYVYAFGENLLQKLEREMGKDKFFEMLSAWYNENLGGIVEGYAFVNHVIEYDSSDGVRKLINEYISDEYLQ